MMQSIMHCRRRGEILVIEGIASADMIGEVEGHLHDKENNSGMQCSKLQPYLAHCKQSLENRWTEYRYVVLASELHSILLCLIFSRLRCTEEIPKKQQYL